jgi:hypothetical protein
MLVERRGLVLVIFSLIFMEVSGIEDEKWKTFKNDDLTIYQVPKGGDIVSDLEGHCDRFEFNCIALYCDFNSTFQDGQCLEADEAGGILKNPKKIYIKYNENSNDSSPTHQTLQNFKSNNESIVIKPLTGRKFDCLTIQGFHYMTSGFWSKFKLADEVLPIVVKLNSSGGEFEAFLETECSIGDVRIQFVEFVENYQKYFLWLYWIPVVGVGFGLVLCFLNDLMNETENYGIDHISFIILFLSNVFLNFNNLTYFNLSVYATFIDVFLGSLFIITT